MKQRVFILGLILVVLAALSVSVVSAQGGLPSCSVDEFEAAGEAFSSAFATYEELVALPDSPTIEDLSSLVMVMDAFSVGYWEGFSEIAEEGLCAEVFSMGYTSGLVFDETLIVAALTSLAVRESQAGNADLANSLLEFATARQATLETDLEDYRELMAAVEEGTYDLSAELPSCDEADTAEVIEGLGIIFGVYQELGTATATATGTDVSALITGYATLSADYWTTFFPVVPACYEANELAYNSGLILDESLTIVVLSRLAQLEAEAGNTELAEVLAASAEQRVTTLQDDIAYYFADYLEE